MTPEALRHQLVNHSLFVTPDLAGAIQRLGYVQADPIRAPARAQDLILRQRVAGYRVDDLERLYPDLPVVEDMLHNYGFFPHHHLNLLYPRTPSPRWRAFADEHRGLRRKVLGFLADNPLVHPRELESAVGEGARVNGWGSASSATTLMLECLHREGRVQVAKREAGIRVYRLATTKPVPRLSPAARADGLIRLMVNAYAPLPTRSLTQLVSMMGHYKPDADYAKRIDLMLRRGELAQALVDGLIYVWPQQEAPPQDAPERVRLLAPFDPVVWDRRRFEHLWGWAYRFEAYTPAAKRQLGYYALPLLWCERVIGWGNARVHDGKLSVEFGYATKKPREAAFREALDEEVERLRFFLLG
ncbi:MAG: YcaQ family DNA glycosylase [Betaproteobacteria bacterium]|nr:YcaQ family DNA glycosylase [Betaproteobacteria bacterium]